MTNGAQHTQVHKEPPANTRNRAILFLCIIIVFFGVTAFICQAIYKSKSQEILGIQKAHLQVNASGSVDSMVLWASDLDMQARRVSESDLYRVFAMDASQLDPTQASSLNDSDTPMALSEDTAQLAEQMPLMRNVLLDFMKYNGFQDARVVGAEGITLLSALTMPSPLLDSQRQAVRQCIETGRTVFGMVRSTTAGIILDFAAPLLPAQANRAEGEKPVAALLLSVPATGHVAQFLSRAAGPEHQFTPWLLQKNGNQWETIRIQAGQPARLSPGSTPPDARGTLPFELRVSVSDEGEVYSLGSRVPELGWVLVQEVPAARVDGQLREAFSVIFGIGLLLGLGLLLLLSLMWWVMVGREQRGVAQRFEKLYNVIQQQKQLLDSINVSLDVGLFMADTNGTIQVANRAFAHIVDKDEDLLPGQTLGALFPGQVVGRLQDAIHQVAETGNTSTLEITLHMDENMRLFRVTLFPFVDKDSDARASGAVVTLQDITEFRRQSEARRKQQMQTIEALVGAIEKVDPYLTGHSRMMRRLSELISGQMHLNDQDANTLSTAASLSQMGKIFVPRELLTKTGKLTPEEQAEMARVPEYAYSVLRNIDFGMPVPTALLQMYEKLDGTGHPHNLKGDAIGLHGRVLAVLNAFCAMVSPRSFRNGLSIDVALDNLRKQSDAYDQNIVEALAAVLRTAQGAQIITQRQQDTPAK